MYVLCIVLKIDVKTVLREYATQWFNECHMNTILFFVVWFSDDPNLLRQIQKSFEENSDFVVFKNIEFTEKSLTYREILETHTNYQGNFTYWKNISHS